MSLAEEVLSLLAGSGVDDAASDLVLASLGGPGELEAALAGNRPDRPNEVPAAPVVLPGAYLASIEVSGFRGIGPEARLDLDPSPGLTVVVGRNGSGKSSFAEALEVLLTGDSWRWRNKSAVWRQGWRNLHSPDGAKVAGRFIVEGAPGPTVMTRQWEDDSADVGAAETIVQPHGRPQTDLASHGWESAMSLHRPLLSHPELAAVADTPSTLFDALSAALGLDELSEAAATLRQARLELEKPLKTVKKDLKDTILPTLAASDDERAALCATALSGRTWNLDDVEGAVAGLDAPLPEVDGLAALTRLTIVPEGDVQEVVGQLRAAAAAVDAQADSESGRSRRIADLLETALAEHADHGDETCPVCGVGTLDDTWRQATEKQLADLRNRAAAFDQTQKDMVQTRARARGLISPAPAALATESGVDTSSVREAWAAWADAPEGVAALADHLEVKHPVVAQALAAVVEAATRKRSEIEDAWRPLALQVGVWATNARQALAAEEQVARLKTAEAALTGVAGELRSRRFEPISRQAIELWQSLRLQSNVELTGVELVGRGNQRRVDLAVTVDGADGAALGVVSQGEVNCLALSLFFPRVMLADSPFRFIVIDDPVQAMDPARVDGLARVLTQIAESRQLVVFTHDDRLPASLLHLGLAHKVLRVTRRPGSVVEVGVRVDPVLQYFRDARAVAKDEQLPDGVAARVVPGFCRSGIEAACIEAVRRRRLLKGDSHLSIEDDVERARTTVQKAALALFDDSDAGGRVLRELNSRWGREAGDAFNDAREGAHKAYKGSLVNLVTESEKLAARLRGVQ